MRKSTKLKIFRRKKRSVILSVLKRHSLRQHTAKQIATGAAKDVIKKVTEGAANNVMDEYVATPENAGMPNAVKRESRDNLILSY